MPLWLPFAGLIIFPLAAIFPFNIIALSWGFNHGNQHMPPALFHRSHVLDRRLSMFREGLLVVLIAAILIKLFVPVSEIGLNWGHWQWNLALGGGLGALQVIIQGIVSRLTPHRQGFLADKRLGEGSGTGWIISNSFSVFAEEIWIAFCFVALKQTGHATLTALVLVGAAFGAAHYEYRLGALTTALYGIVFASLFHWRGSLIPCCVK
jgi:hypothetical protein